jgi:hypothetical protein
MRLILGVALWCIVLAGGLPRDVQDELDRRFAWWHSRLIGTISSFIEFLCGLQMLRSVLLLHGLERMGPIAAWTLGSLALFLLCEGIVRLGITLRARAHGAPSLIAILLVRALGRLWKPGIMAD